MRPGGGSSDGPDNAQLFLVPVSPGDVLVVATDGLFDNVFDADVIDIVERARREGKTPEGTAGGGLL